MHGRQALIWLHRIAETPRLSQRATVFHPVVARNFKDLWVGVLWNAPAELFWNSFYNFNTLRFLWRMDLCP